MHKWFALALGGLVCGAALILALAHLAPVRGWALSRGLEALRAQAGIDAQVGRLGYNLLSLEFALQDVRLTAQGATAPFFEASQIVVDLPYSVLRGRLALEAVTLTRPRLSIVRALEGASNLPGGEDAPVEEERGDVEPLDVEIGNFSIEDFAVSWDDRVQDFSLRGGGLDLSLARDAGVARGTLRLNGEVSWRLGDRESVLDRLEGDLAFDGSNLTLTRLAVRGPEADLAVEGRVLAVTGSPRLDLAYRAGLDVGALATWLPVETADGVVALSGRVDGPAADPTIEIDFETAALALGGAAPIAGRGASVVTLDRVRLESFQIQVLEGTLEGLADVRYGDWASGSELTATWQDLDAGSLLRGFQTGSSVDLDAVLNGQLEARWTALSAASLDLSLVNESSAARESGLAATGTLEVRVADGGWRALVDQTLGSALQVTGDWGGSVSPEQLVSSEIAGAMSVSARDLAGTIRELRAAGLEGLSALDSLQSQVASELAFSGTIANPEITGTVSAEALAYNDLGPGTADVTLAVTPARLALETLEAQLGASRLGGRLTVNRDTRALDGRLQADLRDLSDLASLAPELALRGSATATGSIAGTLDAPSVEVDVEATSLETAGQAFDRIAGQVRLSGDRVEIVSLTGEQADGRLEVVGHYQLSDGAYVARATGRGLRLSPPRAADRDEPIAPVDGRFDLDFEGAGTVAAPRGRGRLAVSGLTYGELALGTATADVELDGSSLSMTAELPSLRATAQGSAELDEGDRFDLELDIDGLDPAELLPAGQVSGALSMAMRASGRLSQPAAAQVRVDISRLALSIGETRAELREAAAIEYVDGRLDLRSLDVTFGDTRIQGSGQLSAAQRGDLDLRLDGELADFGELASLLRPAESAPLALAGDLTAAVRVSGSIERAEASATLQLTGASVAMTGMPPVTGIDLTATVGEGGLALEGATATWQGASLMADGGIPGHLLAPHLPAALATTWTQGGPTASLRARIDGVTPDVLAPFLAPDTVARLGGLIEMDLEVQADALAADRARGTLTLGRAELEVAGVPLSQAQPTRIELQDGQIRVLAAEWVSLENRLEVGGTARLEGERAVDLSARGEVDLRLLGPFLGEGIQTLGEIAVDLQLRGPLDALEVLGTSRLIDTEVRVATPSLAATELEGDIELLGDRLRVPSIAGQLNSGPLLIAAELELSNLSPGAGWLTIESRNTPIEVPPGLRMELDTDVRIELADGSTTVSGLVTVLRGDYREPFTLTGGLLAALQQPAVSSTVAGQDDPLDDIALDVRLVAAEDIQIDNNYANLEAGADLRLVGTLARPAMAGRAALREGGEIFLARNVYEIETGTVDFVSPTAIEPELNIVARTRVGQHDITLNLSGGLNTLEANLSSDPPESERDIISLLLTGRLLDEAEGDAAYIAREQALGLASTELLGTAGRAVGLDTLRVEQGSGRLGGRDVRFDSSLVATETDPGARLTFGKRVSRDVELIFSQSLKESGALTWILGYTPRRNLELRAIVLDDNDRSYEFRHAVSFGGGGQADDALIGPPRPSRQPRRIGEVRISGALGLPEEALREEIRLQVGDLFDFYRWQQDRDRLEALYLRETFREARVRSRRIEEADQTLTIEYTVESGPRTVLRIEGFDLPGGVRADMEDAWVGSVFDGFLLEGLASIARAHLTSEGYLRSTVVPAVQAQGDDDMKVIVVRIDPGPPSDERRIELSGQQQLDEELIRARIDEAMLDAGGWNDPSALADVIEALYREQGLLSAGVTVGEPEFRDDAAVLPVTIDEGPRYRIAEVTLTGVESRSIAAARATLGLEVGAAYSDAEAIEARRRLDDSYRREGFNLVTITVSTTLDQEAGTATVAVDVDEGPRQVLDSVAIGGALQTNPGIIERALRLSPGEPVDMEAWFRARRRLYDSGAFRTVDIEPEPIGSGPATSDPIDVLRVRARVRVEEWPRYQLRYGLQVSDENPSIDEDSSRTYRPGLAIDLTRRNLLGRAITVGASGRATSNFRAVRGFARAPTLFGLPLTSNLFASRSHETIGSDEFGLDTDITDVTAEQRLRFSPSLEMSYGYSFQHNRTFDPEADPTDPFRFDITVNVARLTAALVFDSRDDFVDATQGFFHSSGFEYAPRRLGSDVRFVRYLAQQSYFHGLGRGVVLASSARVGIADAFDQELIPSERFFAGGGNSVRGYAEDSLSPRDFLDLPSGGDALLILNQEIRFPLFKMVRGVGFVDAGNAFASIREMALTDLRVGYGFGLRLDTPFALLRFDYGIRVRRSSDEPFGRFFFSFGQAF